MNRPFLKAGLIGGAFLVLVNLLSLVPVMACASLPLTLIGYVVVGALAASWVPPRRETGRATGQGALAGLIAGLISGVAQSILTSVSLSMSGGTQEFLAQLPPETVQELQQAGIDPGVLFSAGAFTGFVVLCCLPAGLVVGAALGALGGAIFAAVKPE